LIGIDVRTRGSSQPLVHVHVRGVHGHEDWTDRKYGMTPR